MHNTHIFECIQIFIPVCDDDCKHWFLVVIDLVKNEIVYLDSLPGSKSTLEGRKRSIKKLVKFILNYLFFSILHTNCISGNLHTHCWFYALYMEDLLTDNSFYACEAKTPLISEFRIVTPNGLGYQADYSYVILLQVYIFFYLY